MIESLTIRTPGQGLLNITDKINEVVHQHSIKSGLCTLFIQHTSASFVIQENADPSAKYDLENWLNRIAPEKDPHYTHILEGDDDMPAHLKSAITNTSLSIPIQNNALTLGTWQGIYLWEHRHLGCQRSIVIHISE